MMHPLNISDTEMRELVLHHSFRDVEDNQLKV